LLSGGTCKIGYGQRSFLKTRRRRIRYWLRRLASYPSEGRAPDVDASVYLAGFSSLLPAKAALDQCDRVVKHRPSGALKCRIGRGRLASCAKR